MKDVLLDEEKNEFNFRERIIVKIFTNTFIKVYNIARIRTINAFVK